MISYRGRGGKRGRSLKLTKNLDRLYKETKCRDFSVVVTRMDFAKILGKFTKVKIQYESSSTPKTEKTPVPNKKETTSIMSNSRLKSNENGMVQFHRKAYNPHPAKSLVNTRRNANINKVASPTRSTSNNVLKEINVLKNAASAKTIKFRSLQSNEKQYTIVFKDPTSELNNNNNCEFSLLDLLPKVSNHILPSEEWCIDYLPKTNEPKNDKVYDRIAAELEDLMYNEKRNDKSSKPEASENKVEEFPSIMDILNDNVTSESNNKDQNSSLDLDNNLESHDVEAMLLGKTSESKSDTPMDVGNTEVNKLIDDVVQLSSSTEPATKETQNKTDFDNPHSPSILDEALQEGNEEHLPNPHLQSKFTSDNSDLATNNQNGVHSNVFPSSLNFDEITHVMFKKVVNGRCIKCVTCLRNLKYSIELEDKSVEFVGAPKYVSNLDDLQILLQIVNETDLTSLYISLN